MEYEINHIPYKMGEISEQLFNSPFLSDVTFIIGDNVIYAHALELMKRSTVFQKQLSSALGCKQIIPITEYGYDIFYQLIRYIYTDEYTIGSAVKQFELLKLAKVYIVVRLINHLLNCSSDYVKKLDFCVVEKHEIGINVNRLFVTSDLNYYLRSDEIVLFHPDTMEEILKFEQVGNTVSEIDFVDALVRWMNHYCTERGIQFVECRDKFRHLIGLVRFRTMSVDQMSGVKTKYPDLLADCEFNSCIPRTEFVLPYGWKEYASDTKFETKFSVSSELILAGFVFTGFRYCDVYADVTISCHRSAQDVISQISLTDIDVQNILVDVSLGESIRVRPNFTYTIAYTYVNKAKLMVPYRKPPNQLIIKAPPNSVQILEAHDTMFEILFLVPDDGHFD